jgi:glutathione S-transferase
MITIYNFARGARGVRVMWQCEEMGLPYEVRLEGFPTSAAYRALNPLGTVPFLEDEGGVAMLESAAMLLYLAQRYGPTPLLPLAAPAQLARVLQLLELGEATLGAGLNVLLTARFTAPEADKRNWSVEHLEARIRAVLEYLATVLAGRAFFAGAELTLADISLAPALGLWLGPLGRPLPPALEKYLEQISARDAYQRARTRAQGTPAPA